MNSVNRSESHRILQLIRHLYEVEQLTIAEIAGRLGMTRQAVHERMVRNGIERRSNIRERKTIERDVLRHLYEVEQLPVYKVAKSLGVTGRIVERELKNSGIALRPKYAKRPKPSEIDGLAVGESVVLQRPKVPKPYGSLYLKASVRGVRISITRIDAERIRVTRVE